jgi:hypothetical protein
MARYIQNLIDEARRATENEDFSDTIGIKDIEILRYLNDAQFRIHNLIVKEHPDVFIKEKVESVVADQEKYALPMDTFVGNKVRQVEFSATGLDDDYYPLRPASYFQRNKGAEGDPQWYIRNAGNILLLPVPQTSASTLRISYVYKLPKLDLRRGSVAVATLDSGTSKITTLTADVSTDVLDTDVLDNYTRLTIVDEEGNVKMKNIKFTATNATSGAITIDSSFTYESGETIAVGDYIVAGDYTSTHTQLDDMIERYLIAYTSFKLLQRDSSADVAVQQSVLAEMETEIVDAFAEMSQDIVEIPDIISYEDEWGY